MKNSVFFISLSCLFLFPVLTRDSRAQEKHISITVYQNNLGLVHDVRKIDLKAGDQQIRFTDVPSSIDPTSVHFKSLSAPDQVAALEQNYEYDLVSAEKILQKYIDQVIQLFTKEGKVFEGKLLSTGGNVVLEKKDGGIQSIAMANVLNVDFPELPAGLITRPTLVWYLSNEKAGTHTIETSYLTGGIGWHAEYVALVNKDETTLDLSAWVSIQNQSGTDYEGAKLKLVAGDVHRITPPPPVYTAYEELAMEKVASAPQFKEKAFFEYHLYTLQRDATIKNNQIKQLSLFPTATTSVKKIYEYDGSKNEKKINVKLEFINAEENGLGLPIPAGKVRVYKSDEDQSQIFLGEDQVDHTPKNEKIRLYVGDAFDIVGERKQINYKQLGDRAREETWQIKLRNHKKEDVEILVIEHVWGDFEIRESSHPYHKKDANTLEFLIPVKKDTETIVKYTILYRW
ncbi:MAG: DUF4139 domain-containing protein [Candidatus Jettenia sp.]|uniref:DUF4139 domain-containing protein n=1 Tax=Candidatus Jettenia sp. AMX1 TaxID=2293637 RepID=UPI0002D28831|nr:DUF4139 domain-containing protein [Candidatus Jettenia sp. AMX1]MBC6929187.1 DUF4139 domain-containing protein [Candidatus Jettenia sp.]WKZ16401.1 MAG: DUF4139 domain-containing protein [Candidatus Jettenia caeni]KAA0250144.1 MAG: DUF4139 domain-containing protein [Candidatus Jettenia sp. AMX1]MCE7880580.1 DUF4139 domain-containing protein [Candidatus Jettenia sp. AMX1]MCQ3927381.1 DUF4139 domain-containing protein [Candidatus Jettenia sp.]